MTECSATYRLYLAPIQGHTDFIYRGLYHKTFGHIDKYFIPYITHEHDGSIRSSKLKDMLSQNNTGIHSVPQILPSNEQEALSLCRIIKDNGFSEVNVNLGCPFPMLVNRGKGCGLLLHPEKIEKILFAIFDCFNLNISVKTRSGLNNHDELEPVIPILNKFPLTEVILHPRYGKQMYKGLADIDVFLKYKKIINHPMVYNGDIDITNVSQMLSEKLRDQQTLMIGRGILQNPLLPFKILSIPENNAALQIIPFIEQLINGYIDKLQQEPHVLHKMQEHIQYLGDYFPSEWKIKKKVNKARDIGELRAAFHIKH